jgi:hypothetical protein
MKSILGKLIFLVLIVVLLPSCGAILRESGFAGGEWSKLDEGVTPKAYDLRWKEPKISIGSSCDGINYTALWGPYIVVPLFIIPNPFWPFTYTYHTTHHVTIDVYIESATSALDWQSISTKLRIDNNWLQPDHVEVVSAERHKYIFKTMLTCSKLENSEIGVDIEGSRILPLNTTVRYKHRWRIYFEGI